MGIIKAAGAAASGMWEDQWKEVFWCDAMASNELLVRGTRRTSPNSANQGGNDGVITEGSIIIVNEGQCAVVVDNGRVVAAYPDPGEHVFRAKKGMKGLLKEFGKRVSYGGDAPYSNMRIYYINLRESYNHPFTVMIPVQYSTEGVAMTSPLTISGTYCCRVTDPVLFYQKITGNVENHFNFSGFGGQMDRVFHDHFASAVSSVCAKGIRIDQIGTHTKELCKAMQKAMSNEEICQCGVSLSNIYITAVGSTGTARTQRREDLAWIGGTSEGQGKPESQNTPKSNTNLQSGALSSSLGNSHLHYTPPQPRSYRVYPAAHLPGVGAPELPAAEPEPMPAPTPAAEPMPVSEPLPEPVAVPAPAPVQEAVQVPLWVCSCGAENRTRFCTECGKGRSWQCLCGHINYDSVCEHCGAPMQE